MIPVHMEPKGLSRDAIPLTTIEPDQRRKKATRGSKRLRDAILRFRGIEPPAEIKRSVARQLCPACLTPVSHRRQMVADIQQTVAAYYGMSASLLTSQTRCRRETRARQVAMYLSSQLTSHSIAGIGRLFNRDHTTVLHAIKQVNLRANRDPEEAFDVALLRERLAA